MEQTTETLQRILYQLKVFHEDLLEKHVHKPVPDALCAATNGSNGSKTQIRKSPSIIFLVRWHGRI
jgi:hypothetical protein